MLHSREVRESDWPLISHLASNEYQEADHGGIDHIWVENRRSFDGERKDALLESDGSAVGYCSIEREGSDDPGSYRVFLIADWNRENAQVHEALFEKVERMLQEANARYAWMRELTGDAQLLDFVAERGFAASAPYTVLGKEMVNLAKTYRDRS